MRAHREDDSTRLEAVIRSRLPLLSRREVREAIARGMVTVNGRLARKGYHVLPDDQIDLESLVATAAPSPDVEVPIVHMDEAIIVVDKPACVPVSARRIGGRPSIAAHLLGRFPELAVVCDTPLEAGLLHRLDTGTSGLLLVARTRAAWQDLRRQFRQRTVRKRYFALVHGRVTAPLSIAHDLAHDHRASGRMVVAEVGRRSRRRSARTWRAMLTLWPLESRAEATLLTADLLTGVTHQIRVQLSAIGHPIVGDTMYGGLPALALAPERHLLHAASLHLSNPLTKTTLALDSSLPEDFASVLQARGFSLPGSGPGTLP